MFLDNHVSMHGCDTSDTQHYKAALLLALCYIKAVSYSTRSLKKGVTKVEGSPWSSG